MPFHIEYITIFPEIFNSFLDCSLLSKAIQNGKLIVTVTNLRDYAEPPHYKVDDEVYGGAPGMLLKPEPLAAAIRTAKSKQPNAKVIYLTPSGQLFSQSMAKNLTQANSLIILCGRYEGIDQRIIDLFIDLELSIGDYVLMGGEIPAMVITEAVVRLLDSVVGNQESVVDDSFSAGQRLLEGPQYTRPQIFEEQAVPEILLSGDHAKISNWRKDMAIIKTAKLRPELFKKNNA